MDRDPLRGEPLSHVVAQRHLQSVGPDGVAKQVVVSIGEPKSDPRFKGDWSCVCQIAGLGDDVTRTVVGMDAIDAFMHALRMVGIILRHLRQTQGLRITWLDEEDLGLPDS
jgi:uncharacterized protein DUF6968